MLNFNGRVEDGSPKNFQLIQEGCDEIILQFGKINDTSFAMDFQYPLSPYQAFGICLTSLSSKFACE
jgi:tubby-related protein 1